MNEIDLRKRKFLKLLLIASGVFVLTKIVNSMSISSLERMRPAGALDPSKTDAKAKDDSHLLSEPHDVSIKTFQGDFRIRDDKERLVFFDKEGKEIFSLNKNGEIVIGS